MRFLSLVCTLCLAVLILPGCSGDKGSKQVSGANSASSPAATPKFTLAWSEYPSWSVFGVADELGLLNKDAGKQGDLEKKWNVDVVLKGVDYDTCIQLYGSGEADAVCITNMDILGSAASRNSVAIFPTSTSVGGDACVTMGIDSLEALKGKKTYGLARSVSQYAFERILTVRNLNPKDFPFESMDPQAAATAMQSGSDTVKSIMVWNPFVMDTLKKVAGSKRLFDSAEIPEEIIDMVVMGKDSMSKDGSQRFARCLMEAFYTVNQRMEDPKSMDATLVAIGAKFSNLQLEDMKQVVEQTKFYKTPADALALYRSDKFKNTTMPAVVAFCVANQIVESTASVGFDQAESQLNFDTSLLQGLVDGTDPK
jgi:ABC-type nitrate/sulfonate/bicarbonate transport system substrate-binding protein